MNCKEVSLALDDRDIGALGEAERTGFDEHVASCADCAHDWALHQRLAAGAVPDMPVGLPAQVRSMVTARSRGRAGRMPVRLTLLGAVLALGAAASMLLMRDADQVASSLVTAQPTPTRTAQAAGQADGNAPVALAASPTPAAEAEGVAAGPAALTQASGYVVRLLPLQNLASDAPTRAAAELFYASVLDELRSTYGIVLIHPDSTGFAPDAAVDCEVTVFAQGLREGKFEAWLSYFGKGGGKVCNSSLAVLKTIDIAPNCGSAAELSSCNDPVSAAVPLVRSLLKTAGFPVDPMQRPRWLARLGDSKLDPRMRLKLLQDLMGHVEGGIRTPGYSRRLEQDPTIIRAAIELGANSTDAAIRARTWYVMRAVRVPSALVNSLVASAQRDPDGGVRLQAVATLVADYADDPTVREALAGIASRDSRPVVRALAQRNVTGDAPWRAFIVASLEDRGMSDSERAAALYFEAKETGPGDLRDLFDDEEAVKALAEVVPAAYATSGQSVLDMGTLLRRLGVIKHPAIVEQREITTIFLGALDNYEFGLQQELVGWLAPRIADPRVLAALERIANDGSEQPSVRDRAAEALKTSNQSPAR